VNINVGGGAIVDFNTAGSFNPADATTYYFGGFPGLAPSTSATSRKLWMPRAGVIRAVYGNIVYLGAGSNEASTLSLRLNDTTDTQITATLDLSNAGLNVSFNNAGLSIPVAQGDFVSLKWVTPTWTTNPTAVFFSGSILVV
jgi:hypothetical protein